MTREKREAIALAKATLNVYRDQAFDGDDTLHPKSKHAAYSIQCDPPEGFQGSGITKLKCALGQCPDCPKYCQPISEQTVERPIKFYSFKRLPTCSSCGALPENSTSCCHCVAKHKIEKDRGKIKTKKHLILNDQPFEEFFKLYESTLQKYRIHRFKFLVLSKKLTIDVRQSSLQPGDVALQHDFSEALKIVHNQEVSFYFFAFVFFCIHSLVDHLLHSLVDLLLIHIVIHIALLLCFISIIGSKQSFWWQHICFN